MNNDFEIYRLCRDSETVKRLKKHEKKYNLPKTNYHTDKDLYTFFNEILKDCQKDYALVCHDDVIVPINISSNVNMAIEKANECFGERNWGILGNAGIEAVSKKTRTFIADPHTSILPYKTEIPILAESLDGNTMLLNIKSLKNKNVSLPKTLKGFHLYDLILCMESYKKGLVCGISSWLYVKHDSPGNYEAFINASKQRQFQNYFKNSFSNHLITSINDNIQVEKEYKHLNRNSKNLLSFEETIQETITSLYKDSSIKLNVLIRIHTPSRKVFRLLETLEIFRRNLNKNVEFNVILGINNISEKKISPFIKEIKKEYSNLMINDIYIKESRERYPRVNVIGEVIKTIEDEDSYIWIVDYDDFVMPEIAKHIQWVLSNNDIVAGDSYVFNEEWDKKKFPITSELSDIIKSENINTLLTGKIYIPVCSIIYKTKILKRIFNENQLLGDYYEDYAITLLAVKDNEYWCLPLPFAGISYHGENTVLEQDRTHWDYSYATFLSEIVNKNLVYKNTHSLFNSLHPSSDAEFESFKKGLIWKYLQKYRKIKHLIKKTYYGGKIATKITNSTYLHK